MANPLDRPLEDVISHTIVADLMGDDTAIRDPVDFAWRAAPDGFRQGVALAGKIVAEMADDHAFAGEEAKADPPPCGWSILKYGLWEPFGGRIDVAQETQA